MNIPKTVENLLAQASKGQLLSDKQALELAQVHNTAYLTQIAADLRDQGHCNIVTYSRKVFIPLSQLCRDVCHYCTFAQTPKKLAAAYLSLPQVLKICHQGAKQGCKEALFTLGEKPELRYKSARQALSDMGYESTLHYVAAAAKHVFDETGLLPHINAGCMNAEEIGFLKKVSASMGIMLESASARLCEKGRPHYGSPDKAPAVRLKTIQLAGEAQVPFTTGILIGIGETRVERIEALLAIRALHRDYGHIQEIIIQNFRAKSGTLMAQAEEPDLNELLWTIAIARILFGPDMSIQAPPNLSPGALKPIIAAGINDWGGVSPVTVDFVNPEAPWPYIKKLAYETQLADKTLQERLTIYPRYAQQAQHWLDSSLVPALLQKVDSEGYPRTDTWRTGAAVKPPAEVLEQVITPTDNKKISQEIVNLIERAKSGQDLVRESTPPPVCRDTHRVY